MKRKSINYATHDGGGWMNACDNLFLARWRGRPCEICGKTAGYDGGKTVRSCGHHLVFKGGCRMHRYEPLNIFVLCPSHHSHYNKDCSPHSIVSTHAQAFFESCVRDSKPEQYAWWMEHQKDGRKPFDKSWCYRDMYVELGGEIHSKTGNLKDLRPKGHAKKVKEIEDKEN